MKKLLLGALVLLAACGGPPTQVVDSGEPVADAGGEPVDSGAVVDAGGPLRLAPGEVAELDLRQDGSGGVTLVTPSGDEQFVLMLASTQFSTSVTNRSYTAEVGTPADGLGAHLVTGCALSNEPWRSMSLQQETPPSGTAVTQGTTRNIDVPTPAGFETISAQAIAVGARAVVWVDTTTAHPANLDANFVSQFLADFENSILPRERTVFGMESDLDGDGHIALVFSPLTYQTAVAFFSGCDLQNLSGCPSSNHGEYLYLTPPATIAPPYNTPNAIKEILTHECSHLIHFNRKVLRNHLSTWDDSAYMDEGIGGFAQDVIGPQAGNLYVAKAGLDGMNTFSLSDTLSAQAYDSTRDGLLRGGSYLFVRSLYDRGGGDALVADGGVIENRGGPAFLRALLDDPRPVAEALPALSHASMPDIATDFYTTLAMSNRDDIMGVAPVNACFSYLPTTVDPKWNRQRGANVYAKFSMTMTGPKMFDLSAADHVLRVGGVEYLKVSASVGVPTLGLRVTVDPLALPRVRVGRVR